MNMEDKKMHIILIMGLCITLLGFITQKFLFLLLLFPFGLGLFKNTDHSDKNQSE